MHNPESVLGNEIHKLLRDFEIQTDHLISARWLDLVIITNNKKKRTCWIVDFAVPPDHWVRLKERRKKDKHQDLARELKKLWNIKVTVIPIVIGAFGTVTKWLIKELEDLKIRGQVVTIQTIALLRSARILETCCHLNSSEKPSPNANVKNAKRTLNNNTWVSLESWKSWESWRWQ